MDAVNIKLTKPINDKGQVIDAITLQPMKGEHLRRFGAPIDLIADTGALRFNAPVISALISALANVPLGAVDDMSGGDWGRCAREITAFFTGAAPDTSAPTSSTSPTA